MTTAARTASEARVASIDALRGLAALSVCVFHFTTASESALRPIAELATLTSRGWLGVQAFFVISGFVVPYAMHRNGYRLARIGTFMLKRLVRLDPPYFVAVLMALALSPVAASISGDAIHGPWTNAQFFGHAFYGVSHLFWNFSWLNPVFWTLEVEFQYYVLIALVFPLLFSSMTAVRIGAVMMLAGLSLVDVAVLHWLSVFAFGVTFCLWHVGKLTAPQTIGLFTLLLLTSFGSVGAAVTSVAVATTLAIWLWRSPNRVFERLGTISFSFYLVHVPVGGAVLHLISGGTGLAHGTAVFLLALVASLAVAILLWRLIERPAQRLAARIRYRQVAADAAVRRTVAASAL